MKASSESTEDLNYRWLPVSHESICQALNGVDTLELRERRSMKERRRVHGRRDSKSRFRITGKIFVFSPQTDTNTLCSKILLLPRRTGLAVPDYKVALMLYCDMTFSDSTLHV